MPTPSRTAAYSAAGSPNDSLQSQPPSSMNVAPRASWTAWNAVRDRIAHGAGLLVGGRGTPEPRSRRYTPSLNRCSTRRGRPAAARTRSPTVGSVPGDSRVARTRNACAVTSASSSASCGFATGTPSRPAVDVNPYPKSAARRGRRPVRLDRQVPDVDRAAAPPRGAPAEDRRQEVHLDVRVPHQEVAAADRLAEREPRLIQPGSARQVLRAELVDLLRGHGRRDVRIDQLMQRVGEHDPSAAHGNHAERHDDVAREVQARRLEVERDELDVPPRPPADDDATGRRPSSGPLDPHDARLGDDGVHPEIEVAVRQVVVHQLDVEPDADPSRVRAGSSGGTGRRTRRRSRRAVPIGRTRRAGVTTTSIAAGSIASPSAGSHAPNDVIGDRVARGERARLQVAVDDPSATRPGRLGRAAPRSAASCRAPIRTTRTPSPSTRARPRGAPGRARRCAPTAPARSEPGISSRAARTRRRTARFARLRSAPLIARSAPRR